MSIEIPVTKCTNCGSRLQTWEPMYVNKSGVVDGRLRMHDVECVFALGCDECSETLGIVSASDAASYLPALRKDKTP